MKKILLALFLISNINLYAGAILDAKIELKPNSAEKSVQPSIQPGKEIIITATITNEGTEKNKPGHFYVKFAYPTPLAAKPNSELFITEKILLPPISPGKEATIQFKTTQMTPSLFDFVRNDYAMRQYQAIVVIEDKQYLIGTATLTFSAQYYPGLPHEISTTVPASN